MKKLTKWLAVALAVCTAVSLTPAVSSFASEEEISGQSVQEANLAEPVVEESLPAAGISIPDGTESALSASAAPAQEEIVTTGNEDAENPAEDPQVPESLPELPASFNVVEPSVDLLALTDSAPAPVISLRSEAPFDNSTTLPDGTYPVSEQNYSFTGGTGKARLTVQEVVVADGKATAVFSSSSANMTHVFIGYESSEGDDPSVYDPESGAMAVNVYPIVDQQVLLPVRVNEDVALAGRTVAMSVPHWVQYTYRITIDENTPEDPSEPGGEDPVDPEDPADPEDPEVKPEDGRIELEITNTTGMFKAVSAFLETKDGKTELVMALSGNGYRELFKGNYDQAVANGDNRDNWIHGAKNSEDKWEFRIPLGAGETYVPLVGISQSYLDGYAKGQNSLERAFYPRQVIVNPEEKTIITGDYAFSQALQIINNVTMFKPEAAVLETLGGPNSNNYRSDLALTMGTDSFDRVFIGSKEDAAAAENTYEIEERTFTIPVRWLEVFGQPETMQTLLEKPVVLSFHSVNKDDWYERVFTISEKNGTLTVDPVSDDTPVDPVPTPTPTPQPEEGGEGGSEGGEAAGGGTTAAIDSSTGLADGVYTPDKFSFSGGTGKIAITCSQVEVKGGQAYATLVFSNTKSGTTEMSYVKANGQVYYCNQAGGTSVCTIPVELNKNNSILALTTKMSAAHEIAYTIFVYIAGADAKKGNDLTENTKLDEEAPTIAGLEYTGEEELEEAEYFKIFNYSDGIRLIEIDMKPEKEEKKDSEETSEKAEAVSEESSEKDSKAETTVIDEETGLEVTLSASKEDAQAELYKGNVVKYLVVPEDVEIPAGLDKEAIVILTPVKGIYSGSDEVTKKMEDLKVADLIKAQVKEDKEKKIAGAGDYKDLNLRTLVKNKCAIAMLPGEILKDKKEKETFISLGDDLAHLEIAALVDRSELEKTDKAKAEWLKVYGVLYGCEEAAKNAYDAVK